MRIWEKLLLALALGFFAGLSYWLQFGLMDEPDARVPGKLRHDPDYYVENFRAVGMDDQGRRQFVIESERLVHYPDDDTGLLDKPHIIQYRLDGSPVHTYAESGWVSANGDEVLLTGKVRMLSAADGKSAGGVMTTDKMRVNLKKRPAPQSTEGSGPQG